MPPVHRAATQLADTAVPLEYVPVALPDEPVAALLQRMAAARLQAMDLYGARA